MLAGFALASLLGGPALALAAPSLELETPSHGSASHDEQDIRRLITNYAQAIEARDIPLFKKVKPNLSKEEEERLRRAFETIQSQVVKSWSFRIARFEARVMFEALLTRFEGLEVTAPLESLPRVHSNLIDGYAHVPISWDSLQPAGSRSWAGTSRARAKSR